MTVGPGDQRLHRPFGYVHHLCNLCVGQLVVARKNKGCFLAAGQPVNDQGEHLSQLFIFQILNSAPGIGYFQLVAILLKKAF